MIEATIIAIVICGIVGLAIKTDWRKPERTDWDADPDSES